MKKIKSLVFGLLLMLSVNAQATSMTDYMENKMVDVIFRATAFSETAPASYYIALFTTSCSDTGGGTEVTGGSYARVAVTRSVAAWLSTNGATSGVSSGTNGTTSNAAAVTFPAATADWGTATYWGIFDSITTGNLVVCAILTSSRNITNGSTASFGVSALTFQIDN